MEVKLLTKEENEIISAYITGLIVKEYMVSKKRKSIEAIFSNSYNTGAMYYIDLQFVKNDISCVNRALNFRIMDDLVIRKIEVPSKEFNFDLDNYRKRANARVNAMNLFNGDIIVDTEDNYYQALADKAATFEAGKYANNVTFEPPIGLPKMPSSEAKTSSETKVKKKLR